MVSTIRGQLRPKDITVCRREPQRIMLTSRTHHGHGGDHQFGAEVTPRVLSEDAIFDALTEHERLMKALLHLVASSVFMDDTDPDEG